MKITIDGNEANVSNLVGVSVYTYCLLKEFKKKACQDLRFEIVLKNPPLPHLPKENEYFKYKHIPGKILWSRIFLPLYLFKQNLTDKTDVFFSPAHYAPKFLFSHLVVTIHDLSYIYFPNEFLKKDLYKLQNWTKESVLKAKKIIAVSKTTKKDLIKFYQIPEEKITVVYNGFSPPEIRKLKKTLPFELKKKKYFLFVSTIQPRKNIVRLAEAFDLFLTETKADFKLVIAGKKGWLYDQIFSKIENLKHKDKIIFTGYIDEETKALLYKNSFAFIHPSLYEGFGIPILEAFYFQTPVIASFTGALPEIAAEAALYFDPKNTEEIKEKIKELVYNERLRKELIEKGKERLKNFSWKKCAEETLEVITNLR